MTVTSGMRRYGCDQCDSLLCGIAVFRDLFGEHFGEQIWCAPENTSDDRVPQDLRKDHCPFCFSRMHEKIEADGRVAVCKTCQVIWADREALASFPTVGSLPHVSAENIIPRCANCGAAIEHSWDEQCKYWDALVAVPTRVVFAPSAPEGVPAAGVGRMPASGAAWRVVGNLNGGIAETLPW